MRYSIEMRHRQSCRKKCSETQETQIPPTHIYSQTHCENNQLDRKREKEYMSQIRFCVNTYNTQICTFKTNNNNNKESKDNNKNKNKKRERKNKIE
jgi:hypothetical protein